MRKLNKFLNLFLLSGITLVGCDLNKENKEDNEPKESTIVEINVCECLTYSLKAGVGASIDNENKVVTDCLFTDGSFDHDKKVIYTPNINGSGLANGPKGEISLNDESLESLLLRSDEGHTPKIYTALTFDLSVKNVFMGDASKCGLFMNTSIINNLAMTRFEVSSPKGEEPATAKAFRVAFVPKEGEDGVSRTVAALQNKNDCRHLDGTIKNGWNEANHFGGVSYNENDIIDKNYHESIPTSGTLASYINRPDYLGTFDSTKKDENGAIELNFTVVCWFEGTDPSCNNSERFQSVLAHFALESVPLPNE